MNQFTLELTTPPDEEPITVAEAKAHIKESSNEENDLIEAYIVSARQMIEQITRRALVTQTWKLYLDTFPGCDIELPYPKLQSVTNIQYYDADNALQTLSTSEYQVQTKTQPGFITLSTDGEWPETYDRINAVIITFVAGYGDANDVPQAIKLALKLLVAHWFENREPSSPGITISEVPKSVDWILSPYRILRLG